MLILEPITGENWLAALAVRVQPEQLPWVASVEPVAMMLLAKCWVRPDGQVWHAFLIRADGLGVGVVGVGVDPDDAPGGVQTAWLHHFLIDRDAQGRGHGRAALAAVIDWLAARHPTVVRVGLNVLPENAAAHALYASVGFGRVGETVDGQSIMIATL